MSTPEEVFAFWFGPKVADDVVPEVAKQWFQGGQATDDAIRERFGDLIEPARRGELDGWADTPEGALALVVVLDQFARNVHRGTPAAFACDPHALALARAAIERGDDLRVSPILRTFFYLPFEHSESLADQTVAVEKTLASCEGTSGAVREMLDMFYDYAVRHREVIERFGRFPHRNAILGRDSTAEERAFLQQPGSSF